MAGVELILLISLITAGVKFAPFSRRGPSGVRRMPPTPVTVPARAASDS
jgi:hypothetical protein